MFITRNIIIFFINLVLLFLSYNAYSQSFDLLLKKILINDESINSSKFYVKKSTNDLSSITSIFTPTLDLSVPVGKEVLINNDSNNTDYDFYEFSAKISQNIYDFGASSSKYQKAKNQLDVAKVAEENTKSNKIFEALAAYLNYIKSYKVLDYAKKSEQRIRDVTQLENEKVARGGGLASNVLQSKAKLAGAKATRVRFEGDLSIATNRFYNIFREMPKSFDSFKKPDLPLSLLPSDEEKAINLAKKNNISLNLSKLSLKNSESAIKSSKSKFFPSIKAIAEYKNKRNVSGLDGTEIDQTYKLEMKYPISIGGRYGLFYKENADYKSSVNQYMMSKYSHDQLERNLEETIRNAWQTKIVAEKNYEFLSNQANISGEFYDLAMKEVKLGNRQLIDILSSETAYINAKSASEGAKMEYELAVYQLLLSMGTLNENLFNNIKDSTNKNNKKNNIAKKILKKPINEKKDLLTTTTKANGNIKPEATLIKTNIVINEEKPLPKNLTENSIKIEINDIGDTKKNDIPDNKKKDKVSNNLNNNFFEGKEKDLENSKNNVEIKKTGEVKNFKLQLGAFSKIRNAEKFIEKIKKDVLEEVMLSIEIDSDSNLYRIKSLENYTKSEAKIFCSRFVSYAYKCILSKI